MSGFLIIEGEAHPAALAPRWVPSQEAATIAADGDRIWIHLDGRSFEIAWQDAVTHYAQEAEGGAEDIARAPMPGVVVALSVTQGAKVTAGETMLVIESMKLETAIKATRDGVVEVVHVTIGQSFERDAPLIALAAED